MKILFVDNRYDHYENFLKLQFAIDHREEIAYRDNPVGLPTVVNDNSDLQLIILDVLWEEDSSTGPIEMGLSAMRDLASHGCRVPVVIHSVIDDEATFRRLIPELTELGAVDWASKEDSRIVRSYRFEKAYELGRQRLTRRAGVSLLRNTEKSRSCHMAVLFVDVSGFTALCEVIPSADCVEMLKAFYGLVSGHVISRGGRIDKYVGDAVMAVFPGGGQSPEELYVNACIDAARHILAAGQEFKISYVDRFKRHATQLGASHLDDLGKLRCAIESGTVEVARFDREDQTDITVIGTPVNIAARILSLTKGGEIRIGENAHQFASAGLMGQAESVQYKNLKGTFLMYPVL